MIEARHTLLAADLARILSEPRGIERAVDYPPEEFLRLVTSRGTVGGTLFHDDVPVVAGGVTKLKAPYAFAWLIASRELTLDYLRHVLPAVRAGIAAAKAENLVLCASITPGQDAAQRFARYLGFTPTPEHPEHVVSIGNEP